MTITESAPGSPEGESTELEDLYESLAMGLHAVSQPLTVLRASLWPDNVPTLTSSELSELVETSAAAVERVCTYFNLTRDILNVAGAPISSNRFDLEVAMRTVAERFGSEREGSGVSLEVSIENSLPGVLGGEGLAIQAMAAALRVAQSPAEAGDVIDITVRGVGSQIELLFRTSNRSLNTTAAETLLNLSLLRAILKKQRASFSYDPNPLQLRMCFRTVQSEPA